MASGDYSSSAYRETIRHSSVGERKYIRYFDGRGHFGHVRLLLTPRPGAPCSVSVDAACALPEEATIAAQHAISERFDRCSHLHLPLIGFEVHLMGGTYLPRHSYPEACAIAAWMAFEEALHRAARMIVPGALRITQRSTELVQFELEAPVRLVKEIRAMGLRIAKVFSLPKDIQYQPVFERRAAGSTFPDVLDEWT